MSDGVRRNSPAGALENVRASLLSMREEDLRVGLPPLGEPVARCREEAIDEGSRPPADRESNSHEYQIWLRRTGWR